MTWLRPRYFRKGPQGGLPEDRTSALVGGGEGTPNSGGILWGWGENVPSRGGAFTCGGEVSELGSVSTCAGKGSEGGGPGQMAPQDLVGVEFDSARLCKGEKNKPS